MIASPSQIDLLTSWNRCTSIVMNQDDVGSEGDKIAFAISSDLAASTSELATEDE